jgi:YHS domain-containing protein
VALRACCAPSAGLFLAVVARFGHGHHFQETVTMWRTWRLTGSMIALGALAAAVGCGPPPAKGPQEKSPPPAAAPEQAAEATEGLKELSAEDRAAAETQRTCPVTGELLGSMGKPYKIEVEGRTVFLCCPGCEEKIRKDPEKYFAKMKK